MLLEILIAILLGCLFGIITGLAPGVHINLVSVLVVSIAGYLSGFFSMLSLACFIVSMSTVHTFLDAIPSIFLGAPDDAMALGVLPGHRYLLKGYGFRAVKLTIIGSFGGLLISIILFALFIPIVKYGYPYIESFVGYIILAVVVFMILRDNEKWWALFIFLLSGILGIIVFEIPNLNNPLFPMLSGLFGVATLIFSLKEKNFIPIQQYENSLEIDKKLTIKALISSCFSGFLVATLPGVGGNTAAVISQQLTKDLGDKGFMILVSSINTVNFVLSFVTLLVMDKARNGSVIAMQQLLTNIGLTEILIFLCVSLISGAIAVFLTLWIGKMFARIITKVNYNLLVIGIIAFVTMMVTVLTGFIGLIILITSTAIGLIPAIVKTTRTQAMGCLMVPVMIYFLL